MVAIGTPTRKGKRKWLASGLFYGDVITLEPEPGYQVFLVTNRHVLKDLSTISLRFNPQDGGNAREFDVQATDRVIFHPNPDADLAVVQINGPLLQEQGLRIQAFQRNYQVASLSEMSDLRVAEGDGVFVMGFPMGLVGVVRSTVIVRGGIIARVQDAYAGLESYFLIDCPVFPGNSGGPVLLKPEAIGIGGQYNEKALLIGVVESYIPYEITVNQPSGRRLGVIPDNSGLARILPINLVEETVARAYEQLPDIQESWTKFSPPRTAP